MKNKCFAALLALLMTVQLAACGGAESTSAPPQTSSAPEVSSTEEPQEQQPSPEERAQKLLEGLTTEQKTGQLFLVDFTGATLDDETRAFLQRTEIGNVILFGANSTDADELAALTREIQGAVLANTGVPAFIGIDQEGGAITRIRTGATWFPGQMAMSAANADLETAGRYMGEELRAMGINFNFAPVADVNSNPYNPVINTRSFGDTPQRVSELVTAEVRGLQSGGVAACVKHFPGHGDTSTDSHYGLPRIDKTREELYATELVPFRAAIDGGVDAVMSAHIMFPQIDERYPATLSHAMLTGVLRGELGFKGLIITDGMTMGAIADSFGTPNACVKAVLAGADLLTTGGSGSVQVQQQAYDAVLAAVRSGDITQERLDESVLRILTAKLRLGLFEDPYADDDFAARDWSEHASFAEAAALSSITLTRDERGLLPLKKGENVLFISVTATVPLTPDFVGAPGKRENSVACLLAQAWGGADWLALSAHADNDNGQAAAQAARYDKVVLAVRSAAGSPEQTALIRSVAAANPNLILVSMGSPYDGAVFRTEAGTFLCAYDYTPTSARAVQRVLTEGIKPAGVLPVK